MPEDMRKNIVGLARFVINHCMRILFEPDVTKLDVLIEINQHVAAGLRGNSGAVEAVPAASGASTAAA
jgi:flagellar protein FlaF